MAAMEGMVRGTLLASTRNQKSMRSSRRDIEVFRLPLRDTVNEGDDTATITDVTSTGSGGGGGSVGDDANAMTAREVMRRMSSTSSSVSNDSTMSASSNEASGVLFRSNSTHAAPPVRRDSMLEKEQTSSRDSGRVVLVTRPSQRDIEQWTERATSTMVRSSGGTVRLVTPTQQSKRWVLEYKPVVSHSGWLIKRGHSIRNFKRRLFCIIDHELVYHDTHDSTEVRGRIDLRKRTTVQCLMQSGFSLCQGSYQIILYALDQHDRDEWIKSLIEKGVELLPASAKTAKLIEQQTHSPEKQSIVFSGWLRKRGQMFKSTKRRWFELTSTTLSYYSHPEGGTKKGSLEVAHARISPLDTLKTGERFSFVVHTTQRELILHADSQEERSLWVASLSSVADGSISFTDSTESSMASNGSFIAPNRARRCSCASGSIDENALSADSSCRRCMSSFISKTEDAILDVTREVQLILASPYSPEGSTTAGFLKEQASKPVDNAALREFMTGLSDYMVHKRLNELLVLGGRSTNSPTDCDDESEDNPDSQKDSAEFTERVVGIIGEQIEERVFFPLYRVVHDTIKQQSRADSKLLRGKIEVLQSKSQSFFGIGQNSLSTTSWVSACMKLKEIDKLSLPYMKRNQLVAACKEIYTVYHTEHPTNPPMSADDFIPAFIYVLVQSRLSDPVFVKEMITYFDLGGTQGEAAYFVTCLEIAIEYIRSLVTACTVVLDASQKLGIEFARDHDREIIVVHRLVANGQAEQSQAVRVGDVLVAINGVLVYEMDLSEIIKMVTGIDGDIELCLLSMAEYERRFGAAKRAFRSEDDSSDDCDNWEEDDAFTAKRKESMSRHDVNAPPPSAPVLAPRKSTDVATAPEVLGTMAR